MSVATHRAAICALLLTVAEIGNVHDEEPYARAESAFREFYAWEDAAGQQQLRGWFVRRTRTAEREVGLGRTVNAHTWLVRGFASFDSAAGTGKAFDDLVEAVRRAYRADITLGGAVDPGPMDNPSGLQVADIGPVVLAGALCHAVTLNLTTYEYLNDGE